jgi:hypothetical protein
MVVVPEQAPQHTRPGFEEFRPSQRQQVEQAESHQLGHYRQKYAQLIYDSAESPIIDVNKQVL